MHAASPPGLSQQEASQHGASQHGASQHAAQLGLEWAARREFTGPSPAASDPMLRVYLSDLTRPYGLALREDLLAAGDGQSYGEMAGELLASALQPDQPIGVLVVAFATHDVVPGRPSASYLSHLCPGDPLAFAVCDQGIAAPFTGLRLIGEYAGAGGGQRGLLVIAEQSTMLYDCAVAVPTRNATVVLCCVPGVPGVPGAGRAGQVRVHPGTAPDQVASLLAHDVRELAGGRTDVTLIVGNGLGGATSPPTTGALLDVADVVAAPAGQPATGVWWELAGGLAGWARHGRLVLLADYEPQLGYLGVGAFGVAPAGGPGR